MILESGGYNRTQYLPDIFRSIVRRLAVQVPQVLKDTGATHVVVSGKSGIAVGFALQMLIDVPLVVVRKPGEYAHGRSIEGKDGERMESYVILDDFVATGHTVRRICDTIHDAVVGEFWRQPRYLGVLQYQSEGSDGRFKFREAHHE